MTAQISQEFKITLDVEDVKDPVFSVNVEGSSVDEVVAGAKAYAADLVKLVGARGVEKLDLVNTHKISIFKIPL